MPTARFKLFATLTLVSLVVASLALLPVASAAPGTTTRVSVASDSTQGNRESSAPSISADGRFVAFQSAPSNLVVGDTNGFVDVFVRDRDTDADGIFDELEAVSTTRVSLASDGTEGNGNSGNPFSTIGGLAVAITSDGRLVAFSSTASNLVPGDTNTCPGFDQFPGQCPDVFLHDRQTGQTTRVSVASDGTQATGSLYGSLYPTISADGDVAFFSDASNLVAQDTNDTIDFFVHDRQTGQTTRVNVASDGTEANGPSSFAASTAASISADGRFVAFDSYASNLAPGEGNLTQDVFVHDRQTGQTTRVSDAPDGAGDNTSWEPAISADGRFVAFISNSTNLPGGPPGGLFDVF